MSKILMLNKVFIISILGLFLCKPVFADNIPKINVAPNLAPKKQVLFPQSPFQKKIAPPKQSVLPQKQGKSPAGSMAPYNGNVISAKIPKLKPLPAVIKPEYISYKKGETMTVVISKNFVNRIVFPHYITYIHDSKTGNLAIKLSGKTALITLTPIIISTDNVKKVIYPKASADGAMFGTKHNLYSFIFIPKYTYPRTIYIKDKYTASNNGNTSIKTGNTITSIEKIFVEAYNNKNISGFNKKNINDVLNTQFPQIELDVVSMYKSYTNVLYKILVKNSTNKIVNLSNEEFINLFKNPVAVSISNQKLFPGTYTRLFILIKR